jgi:hypothetical protein
LQGIALEQDWNALEQDWNAGKTTNIVAISPQANYTDRLTTAVSEASANFCG